MGRGPMSFTMKAVLGLTANQIAAKAISDLKSAPSFTMSGTAADDGQTATMSIGVTGKGCTMTVNMGSKGNATINHL